MRLAPVDIYAATEVARKGGPAMKQPTKGEGMTIDKAVQMIAETTVRPLATSFNASEERTQRAVQFVRDAILDVVSAAMTMEREQCAKVADAHANRSFNWASENAEHNHAQANWADRIAAAIRARGNP